MTVSTVVDHNDYTGNGVTTSFPYTFRIFKKDDLAVTVLDLSGNLTVLVLDTDYTVTNAGGYSGGNVVLTAPLAIGWQISIARELEPTQETDLRNQGKFFAEVHEDAFDKLTMLIQQVSSLFRLALRKPSSIANWYDAKSNRIINLADPIKEQDAVTKGYADNLATININKTLRVPESFVNPVPSAVDRANRVLGFNNEGQPVVLVPGTGDASQVMLDLISSADGKGDALITVKQPFPTAKPRTQHSKNAETISITDWAIDGSITSIDSATIQRAMNEVPAGTNMRFPTGTYNFSGVTLPPSILIEGDGIYESGTKFINDSPTAPFFTGNNVANLAFSRIQFLAGPTRTGGAFIDLTNATRVKFDDIFLFNYFQGINVDGGSEISFSGIRAFTNLSGNGVGGIRIGKTKYTGPVHFGDVLLKQHPDNILAQPEYGVRLGFVDVVNFDVSFLCILHGKCLLVDPGNGQIASLIHGNGAHFDTADYGILLAPAGTGKVQAFNFEGVYSGAHRIAALAIDGTSGTVDGASFNGGDYINSSIGIDVTGSKAKNIIINGVKVAGSSYQGIHITNNANVVVKDNFIGNFGFGANNYGIVADVTTSGQVFNNKFQNNTVNIDNQSVNLSVFDNIGIDNWNAFTPTITSQSGTITTASGVLRYRKSFNTVTVNAEITITNNGTGANSVLVTLPFTVRTHAVGVGRAQLISGKELQAFASAGGINVAIRNYDGTYPGTTGEVLIFSITYETQN